MSAAVTGPRPAGAESGPATPTTRLRAWAPSVTCAVLVMLGGLVVAFLGVHISTWVLDETGYKVSAVHYSHDTRHTLFNDYTARATSRLYALTVMPLFAVFDGDVAIRIAKVYNCVLWCSIAVPLWHMARALLTPWRRVAAVTLSVIAPWLTYTTALFTESLALAGFVWFTWAALCALRRPAWWRDLLTVAAFGVAVTARTQMGGLMVGYVLLLAYVLADRWQALDGPAWWRIRTMTRHMRHYPFTTAAVLAVFAALCKFSAMGQLSAQATRVLGGYDSSHAVIVNDGFSMVLVEALGIGTGLGIVAVLFSVPWYGRTLVGRVRDEAWWYAAVTAVVSIALLAFTAWGQGGYWGAASEERYWMYPFAFGWIAAFRAAQVRSVRPRDVAAVGAILVAVAGLLAPPRHLDVESVFFAPVLSTLGSAAVHGIRPLTSSPADAVGLATLVVCGTAWFVVRRLPWVRLEWLLAGGAVIQLALTIVPLLAMTGQVADGRAKRTGQGFAQLGWVDRRLGHDKAVWLASEPRRSRQLLYDVQLNTLFWNGRIETRGAVAGSTPGPDVNPLDALPLATYGVDERTGALKGVAGGTDVLAWEDSPYAQPVGAQLAASPQWPQLRLRELAARPRLQFRTEGLVPGADALPASTAKAARFDVWPSGPAAKVTMTFIGGPVADTAILRRPGAPVDRVVVPGDRTLRHTITVCGPHVQGSLRSGGGATAIGLAQVQVVPASSCPRNDGSRR